MKKMESCTTVRFLLVIEAEKSTSNPTLFYSPFFSLQFVFSVLTLLVSCRFCVMQLIMVPENRLHLYYKKGMVGADPRAEERVEEWENVDDAIKEFANLFEELTGNEFEPWEKEKKIQKKHQKFYPIDMVSRHELHLTKKLKVLDY